MTEVEFRTKFDQLYTQWRDSVRKMSVAELKRIIKHSPKREVLHELELNYRINGGEPTLNILLAKLAPSVQNCQKINLYISYNLDIYS